MSCCDLAEFRWTEPGVLVGSSLPQWAISLAAYKVFDFLCLQSERVHRDDFDCFVFCFSQLSQTHLTEAVFVFPLQLMALRTCVCSCMCLCFYKRVLLFSKCVSCVCVCVCVCVLVGRMSIPSVTVAVPSFHAPAAPRESSSLGSLSVLFNERAPHQNAG